MEETGESSSAPVFYGPEKPPEMLYAERQAARDAAALAQQDLLVASGAYCRCSYDWEGLLAPPDSDSDDEPCPFHPWNRSLTLLKRQGKKRPSRMKRLGHLIITDSEDEGTPDATAGPQTQNPPQQHHEPQNTVPHRPAPAPLLNESATAAPESNANVESTDGAHVPANEADDEQADDEQEDDEQEDDEQEDDEQEDDEQEDDEQEDDEQEDDEDMDDDEYGDNDEESHNTHETANTVLDVSALGGAITRDQLLALLQTQHLADVFNFVDSEDSEDLSVVGFPRRPRNIGPAPEAKPTKEGMQLQASGFFGANNTARRSKNPLMRQMLDREHGLGSLTERNRHCGLIAQEMIPGTRADQILHYDEPVYSGQFSDDGNFYYSVCQDFKVRMYDTSNPYDWKHYKTVTYPWGSWTITDASLSPDNKFIVYSSHSALVCIAPTDPLDKGDPYALNLEGGDHGGDAGIARRMNFSIFSIRFSGDGRELVAGTRQNTIVLYDIEKRSILHTIAGHENDVNAVCFGDKDEPHLIYSGSDDGVLKVWDRRSLNDRREAGAFVGHRGGLTYIDSKNDGRYILSNGKDQTAKLWDVRMAYSTDRFRAEDMAQYTRYADFDYRYMDERDVDYSVHPKDNSIVTFRGHKVQRTLIRCHFAPPGSANSRYVYSGSADGKVHIWNMDSTVAKVIDVAAATKGTRLYEGRMRYFAFGESGSQWQACARDVSWHPHAPVIAASAWNSYNLSRGTTTVHTFTDSNGDENDVPMGRSYNAVMERQDDLRDMQYD